MPRPTQKPHDTSWQKSAGWYNKIVGDQGHYYHKQVVLPGVIKLLNLQPTDSLVDLGCGQGILAHHIPRVTTYLGLDAAKALIQVAQTKNKFPNYSFQVADVTKPLTRISQRFSHGAIILALQNMKAANLALANASMLLQPHGKLVIVLNHPTFRIPRQSGWGVEEKTKQQYRWINRYRTAMEIPITMHPGQSQSQVTWSYHHSLAEYVSMLSGAGLAITGLEEWYSDKTSVGKASKMENRARQEIPLFMTIVATKL